MAAQCIASLWYIPSTQKLLVHRMYSYPSYYSSLHVHHQSTLYIINHSEFNLFPFEYFREFSQYLQRKELKWIKIPVTKEVLRGKLWATFFFVKYFRVRPLKSQMLYKERRVVQCTWMVDITPEYPVMFEKTNNIFFFHAVWGVHRTVIFTSN